MKQYKFKYKSQQSPFHISQIHQSEISILYLIILSQSHQDFYFFCLFFKFFLIFWFLLSFLIQNSEKLAHNYLKTQNKFRVLHCFSSLFYAAKEIIQTICKNLLVLINTIVDKNLNQTNLQYHLKIIIEQNKSRNQKIEEVQILFTTVHKGLLQNTLKKINTKMSRSTKRQLNLDMPNKLIEPQQSNQKFNHIVQIKNELVKMKEFLNKQLPSLNELIPHRNHSSQDIKPSINNFSNQDLHEIVNVNRKLQRANVQLAEELLKQKKQKRQLSKSLKKQERMLSSLYEVTHSKLTSNSANKSRLNGSSSSNSKKKVFRSIYNKYDQQPKQSKKKIVVERYQSQQKSSDLHIRTPSKQISQILYSDPSIKKRLMISEQPSFQSKYQIQNVPSSPLSPQYSQADIATMEIVKQIDLLENRMKKLINQSRNTQNRSKKLQIRTELQKIANKIHYLKDSLDRLSSK